MKNLFGTLAGMAIIVLISGALGYTFTPDRSALVQPTVFSWPDSPPLTQGIVSPADLKARLDSGGKMVIFDARTAAEFEAGHIKGAFNLPPSQFDEGYAAIRPSLKELANDIELVVYCGRTGCGLDARLSELLIAQGHKQVSALSGGWSAWVEAGFPKEDGRPR